MQFRPSQIIFSVCATSPLGFNSIIGVTYFKADMEHELLQFTINIPSHPTDSIFRKGNKGMLVAV